jgi:hypothetical protein
MMAQVYRDGDVVLVRGTIKTVRGEQRLQFKKGEARMKVGDVHVERTLTQVLKAGDLIDYTDIDKPSEPPKRGVIRKTDGHEIWARFDGGGDEIISEKHAVRVED